VRASVDDAAMAQMRPGVPWPLCAFSQDEEAIDALVAVIAFLKAGRRVIVAERPM
jgi:hypothetical protein